MDVICKWISLSRPDSVITTSSMVSSSDGASQAGDSSTEVGLHSVYAFSGLYGNKLAQVCADEILEEITQGHFTLVTTFLSSEAYVRVWETTNALRCQMVDGKWEISKARN